MTVNCAHCGRRIEGTQNRHHVVYRSEGGSDSLENLVTLHRHCHVQVHQTIGEDGLNDFQRWGRSGGKITAKKPEIWAHNLLNVRNQPEKYSTAPQQF